MGRGKPGGRIGVGANRCKSELSLPQGGRVGWQPGRCCPFNKERNKDSTGILQTADWPLYAHRMNSMFVIWYCVHITPQRILKASQQDENDYCGTLVSLQRLLSVYIGTLYLNSVKSKLKNNQRNIWEATTTFNNLLHALLCSLINYKKANKELRIGHNSPWSCSKVTVHMKSINGGITHHVLTRKENLRLVKFL